MAAPSVPTDVLLWGDARALFVTFIGDETLEDYSEVEWSSNGGSSWGDPIVIPALDRQAVLHQPTASSDHMARIRRVYGVDASAWVDSNEVAVTTITAVVEDAVPVEGADGEITYTSGTGSDVYLIVGENVDGQAVCLNPAALSADKVALSTRTLAAVGIQASGASTVTLDASTLTGFVSIGEVITFNGNTGRYRVTAANIAAANTLTNVAISPVLNAAVADNTIATVHSPLGFDDVISSIGWSVDGAPKWNWSNRNSGLAFPLTTVPVAMWNQIGTGVSIASITTGSGNTTVTFAGLHSMTPGWGRWVRFRNTGVANMDNTQQFIVATTTTAAQITGFVASSGSVTGLADFPFLDLYFETTRGKTDWVESGEAPSKKWGPERSFLALAQDSRGPIGDNSLTPIAALKVHGAYSLASRLVGSATTAKRWTRQREVTGTTANTAGSKFTDYVRQMRDMKTFLDRAGSGAWSGPYTIRGIVLSAGYNETASDIAQTRRQLDIVSIAVVGAVATITTAAHSVTDTANKLYNIGIVAGLGGTLGTAINGKHYPISAATSTTLTILDFDATGLTGTVTTGTTVVDVGSPLSFLREMLEDHVTDLREAAIEEFASSQDPEDVPVAIWEPSRDPYWRQFYSTDPTSIIADLAYAGSVSAIRDVAEAMEGVVSFSVADVEHKNQAIILTDELYFGHDGQLEIGKLAWEAIQNPSAGSGTTKRPAVFGALIGDSYVVGTNAFAIGQLANPEAISPETALSLNRGEPIDYCKIWNHATQAWETLLVDPTLDSAYNGRTNCNTNPSFNPGQSPFAGVQCGMARELRLAFPDHDVYLFSFGVNSSTAQSYVPNALLSAKIDGITPAASTVTITLRTSGTGALRILRDAPINVVISGVSGLTPDINGSYVATPTSVSTIPTAPGTQTFTIAVSGVTGTPNVTAAYAAVPQVIWDPDANDVWPELEAQILAAIEAAQADDVLLDGRFGAIYLGTNDAVLPVFGLGSSTTYTEAMVRIKDSLRAALTTRAAPRDEVPIVCLEPLVHGRNIVASSYYETIQTALRAAVADDSRATTLNCDEVADRLEDPVTVSYDAIHPDTIGYFNLGIRTVRALATITDWDAPLDLTGGGSGGAGIIEVLA